MSYDEKHILNISRNGACTNVALVTPGTTVMSGGAGGNVLDKYVRLQLHEVDIDLSAAGTVEFKIGSQSVFKRTLAAAGEIHSLDRDVMRTDVNGDQSALTITISGGTPTVTGTIRWSFDWAGGNVVKKAQDTIFHNP